MHSESESWLLLESGPGAADFNMALDEALLESAPQRGKPVLRFYAWLAAAATFGYFQKYGEVADLTQLRPLIRRPTGGGLVPHDRDWTYSLTIPPGHPWYALSAVESYRRLHEWIRAAFSRVHIVSELSPESRKEAPGQCFIGAERYDLLWQARKIAGAAQRRSRNGLLIQGSVQPPPAGVLRREWERAMTGIATEQWGVNWLPFAEAAGLLDRGAVLAATKYSQAVFNERV